MPIPNDPVLSVDDARSNLHAILAAVAEGREFLVGPRRRAVARVSPVGDLGAPTADTPGAAPTPGDESALRVTLDGDAAHAMLLLAGDSLGFALAQDHADSGLLRVPDAAAAALPPLSGQAAAVLAEAALDAFHAAGGDETVTHADVLRALTM